MTGYNKEDWQDLTRGAVVTGTDALELNLSCPHGMGEKGMGLACGQNAEMVRNICEWVKEVSYDPNGKAIPFFAKLTPNVTDITEIARAAKEGGADGVTAINTVSGLMHINGDASAWPAVGDKKRTTYGGLSGSMIRPMALRAVSAISKALPGFPILATGGGGQCRRHRPVSARRCLRGNQDFATTAYDYITGLQALLYTEARSDLKTYNGMSAPTAVRQKGKPLHLPVGDDRPLFGDFECSRQRLTMELAKDGEVQAPQFESFRPAVEPTAKIPTLADTIGKSVGSIGAWYELAPQGEQQVVASVDTDMCINCGKCYMTCSDTGYQAIEFSSETHLPKVTSDCTGCTLCVSVCPVIDCITLVPRDTKYEPNRGIPLAA